MLERFQAQLLDHMVMVSIERSSTLGTVTSSMEILVSMMRPKPRPAASFVVTEVSMAPSNRGRGGRRGHPSGKDLSSTGPESAVQCPGPASEGSVVPSGTVDDWWRTVVYTQIILTQSLFVLTACPSRPSTAVLK